MTKLIFDGVEYYHNRMDDNVFYKSKYMGKYQEKNGDKIKFLSSDEVNFHYRLKNNTNHIVIKGKSLLNIDNTDIFSSNQTILSFIQNENKIL